MAPLHLDRARLDATRHQTLALCVQSWRSRNLRTVLTTRVRSPAPEYLGGGTSPGPDEAVEVVGVNRLGPDGNFTADDEFCCRGIQACSRVVRVNKLPALEGAAPVTKWRVRAREVVVECEPLATTAVEVLQESY